MSQASNAPLHWFNSTAVPVAKYFLLSSLTLVVLFAWMEPSGAAGLGFWKGLVFWSVQISILIPMLIRIQHGASHYLNLQSPLSAWLQTALSGVLGGLLFVPIGYLLDILFSIQEDGPALGIVGGLLDEASGVVVPVTVTWLALNAPWIFELDFSRQRTHVPGQLAAPDSHSTTKTSDRSTRFLRELESRTSGDLISISSELHYVRVVTTESEVMFLYNLRDAIEELPADAGILIHRSHWVSRGHVKGLSKRDGISVCTLSNGKSLPVSRRKYSEVKQLISA